MLILLFLSIFVPDDKDALLNDSTTNAFRLNHIHRFCSKDSTNSSTFVFAKSHLFVDDSYKLLFCGIPKSAITTWKSILIQAHAGRGSNNTAPGGSPHSIRVLRSYGIRRLIGIKDESQTHDILTNYFKFIVVRHPFLRLISAYKDKFYDRNYSQLFNKFIIHKYRKHTVASSIKSPRPIWTEFARFVALDYPFTRDQHWETYESLCHPCTVRYDAVIKVETMARDAVIVLSRLGNLTLTRSNTSKGDPQKSRDQYIRELPSRSEESLRQGYDDVWV